MINSTDYNDIIVFKEKGLRGTSRKFWNLCYSLKNNEIYIGGRDHFARKIAFFSFY